MQNPQRLIMRIQREQNLNDIYVDNVPGPGNGRHLYAIVPKDCVFSKPEPGKYVRFQCGPRNEEGSIHGITDADLLEIVRHRLKSFQQGKFGCRENSHAITCIEEALMWLAKRANDRAERGVLGTTQK